MTDTRTVTLTIPMDRYVQLLSQLDIAASEASQMVHANKDDANMANSFAQRRVRINEMRDWLIAARPVLPAVSGYGQSGYVGEAM